MGMRWLVPLLLCPLLLGGCGSTQSTLATEVVASTTPVPSPTPHPSRTPKPTSVTSPDLTGPLAGFPLDLGYADTNGNDGSLVTVTTKPATREFGICGRTVWDPRHGTIDRIGVEYRGEAEYARGRTLVLYPDTAAATAAVTAARTAVAACPDEPDGSTQGTTHTVADESLGDQALVWTDTFYSVENGQQQHDTGLVVYELVRVGRVVLLGYEYDEGNGSAESRAQSVARDTREARPLADRMKQLPAHASSAS
jgi:hypothetical protein